LIVSIHTKASEIMM